ncbi:hypothetical protein [Catenuloplanes indicus]|uniref:Lipoprotein n=1 Tax=Catenuloplanes indicus TaxID=137267 RepID=A0AAE3VWX1_9ACTN|nr:hypothetical protein [Catenuloplanes indicus]MDQ0365231.1 hypothetical protein [Catenuloplanes indicus]
MTIRRYADISGTSSTKGSLRRRAVTGVLGALLVALPLSACANGGGVAGAGPGTPVPSTGASASGERIDEATLKESTLTLPAWTNTAADFCPAGEYTFTDGQAPTKDTMTVDIEDVAYVDIDADGSEETVAMLVCYIGQAGEYQVIAFDRDGTGPIETVGTVVMAKLMDEPDGSIVNMDGIRADGNAVAVRVGDRYVCCGGDPDLINWQWRSYGFSNGAFTQVSGDREFPPSR